MRKMLVVDAGSTNYTKRVVFEDGRMEAVENELGEMTTPASILIGKEDGKEFFRPMVHGRLFVFLYCRCINSYLNKTKRKLLFKSFLYSMK